jgi:hypothetical protein
MVTMNSKEKIPNGLRERKRQLTLDLITKTGLKLFSENGGRCGIGHIAAHLLLLFEVERRRFACA